MTLYNVHIYREMKLRFDGIEADSPETAAIIARDKLTEDADEIDDCDGKTFAALVDVVGNKDFTRSCLIDFDQPVLRSEETVLTSSLNPQPTNEENNDGE